MILTYDDNRSIGGRPASEKMREDMLLHTHRVKRICELIGPGLREISVQRHNDILQQGARANCAHILTQGIAYRYQKIARSRRAIVAFLLPGELCELQSQLLTQSNYGIAAATNCVLETFPANLLSVKKTCPKLSNILMEQSRLEEAIARAWIVGLCQRDASERMAHLLCELRERLDAVGLVTDNSFEMRIGQAELADALGISVVHANRALKALKDAALAYRREGRIIISNRLELEKFAMFDASYLRL